MAGGAMTDGRRAGRLMAPIVHQLAVGGHLP
jgi:hypothetical protein